MELFSKLKKGRK